MVEYPKLVELYPNLAGPTAQPLSTYERLRHAVPWSEPLSRYLQVAPLLISVVIPPGVRLIVGVYRTDVGVGVRVSVGVYLDVTV